ncbi:hypothetical protein J6590_045262 [Homalodisca vitripennis]|nr:hypothetical protein J6590_045262 [Homalodisca vitripennis]
MPQFSVQCGHISDNSLRHSELTQLDHYAFPADSDPLAVVVVTRPVPTPGPRIDLMIGTNVIGITNNHGLETINTA